MANRHLWGTAVAIALTSLAPAGGTGCGCGEGGGSANDGDGTDTDPDAGNDDDDDDDDTDDADDDDDGPPGVSECRQPTLVVYDKMRRSCVGCHDEGTNLPLAADFVSFEQLVAYNPGLVVPGRPEDSPLIAMLEGNAPPPLDQMPPGAVSFAELSEMGETDITLEAVEDWITDLEPCDVPGGDLSPRYARRVGAEHIQRMLNAQLELVDEDTYHASRFPIDDPVFGYMNRGHNSSGDAWARWAALGGPDYLRGTARSDDWSPLFIQAIGPTAQAWCSRSLELGHDALFPAAGSDATDESSVRANIEALYLDLLGVVATQDDVDAMYEDVYLHYAQNETHAVAMKAVCSAFIRHPLWLTY